MSDLRRSIQFTTTDDGVSIAYWEVGSGPPLVLLHNFGISHAELEWEVPSFASFYTTLAEHHRLIRFDPRGSGLSGRSETLTVDDVILDLEAVVAASGLDRFALFGVATMGPVVIRFSANNPRRITHLVLCEPDVTVASAEEHARYIRGSIALAGSGSGELIASFWTVLAAGKDAGALLELTRINTRDSEYQLMSNQAVLEWDSAPSLGSVSAPALILSSKDSEITSLNQARQAAATIPDARLTIVDGRWTPYFADRAAVLAALSDFLGWGSPSDSPAMAAGTSTVVFTDVVASTEVLDRLGDEAARTTLRSIEDIVGAAAAAQSGRVVKHLGDGSLLDFDSASDALDFARKVQIDLAAGDLQVRIGMAAGEPIREEGDLHGAVVVMASRITDEASPGDVIASDGVRQLVLGKSFEFEDLGEHALKGFDEPLRIWRLQP